MSSKIFSKFDKLIGLDLGTSRVRLWSREQEVVFNEPPCIALSSQSGQVLAIGLEAAQMDGRVGADVKVEWFMNEAQLTDVNLAKAYFKLLFKRVYGEFVLIKPTLMFSVPTDLPKTKKELFSEMFYELGMGEVYTVSQTLAAAIGSGVPIADSSGCFLLQLGAGLAEGAVISLGRVVISKSSFQAGDYLAAKIAWEVKKETLVELPDLAIEQIKQFISLDEKDKRQITVTGHDLKKRVPKEITLDNSFFLPLLKKIVGKNLALLNQILAKIPPELTTDIVDKGLLLSGSLAQLKGLDEYLTQELKIAVAIVDDPELAVVKGTGMILENLQLFKASLSYVD